MRSAATIHREAPGRARLGPGAVSPAPTELTVALRSANALAAETTDEGLRRVVLTAALEHARAERGLLFSKQGSQWGLEGQARLAHGSVEVELERAPMSSCPAISEASLDNAISRREPVVEESSPHLSRLWVPLSRSSRVLGCLYLEGPPAPGAAASGRRALLQLLAAQAAMALDNLRLNELEREIVHVHRVATLGQMAAALAHEVSQPLSGVLNNAWACLRWLHRPEPDLAEARGAVERIQRDAKRTADVVASVRSLLCRGPARRAPQRLEGLLAEVLDLTRPVLRAAAVAVRLELDDDLPEVNADKVQLQQVVLNLVLNAVDAMQPMPRAGRELVVSARALGGGRVRVAVRDTGVGLSSADTERLFEPFYSTKPTGMGMGLSLSRSIARAHGGDLSVRPNPEGLGATFTLILPADRR